MLLKTVYTSHTQTSILVNVLQFIIHKCNWSCFFTILILTHEIFVTHNFCMFAVNHYSIIENNRYERIWYSRQLAKITVCPKPLNWTAGNWKSLCRRRKTNRKMSTKINNNNNITSTRINKCIAITRNNL